MPTSTLRALTLLAVLAGGPLLETVAAQSFWLEPAAPVEVNLEILKPALKGADLGGSSLVYYLSLRGQVGTTTAVVFELPYANFSHEADQYYPDYSDNTVGNPSIGLEMGPQGDGWRGEVGVRLPTASSSNAAATMGALTDFVERTEAFLPDVLSFRAGANYRSVAPTGFAFGARISPLFWLGTGDRAEMDPELWVLYALRAGYEGKSVAAGAGLSGRYLVTAEGGADFGQRTFHQLGLYTNLNLGGWGPGLQVRVPLDEDLTDDFDPVFSLSLSYLGH